MNENINVALQGIVEGYFEGKNLTELIQAASDSTTINILKEQLSNFERLS